MPEMRLSVSDTAGDVLAIRSDGTLTSYNVPEGSKFYFYQLFDTAGVVAANNFMSVFNPVASTKTVIFYQAEIASYATGASSTPNSLTATRITAASGGTLITGANVNRFVTADPNPQAEVRVGNPTVTTSGVALNSWVPPLSTGAQNGATAYTSTPPGAGFVCTPGQGIVFSTAAGNVNQMWKILTIWSEL